MFRAIAFFVALTLTTTVFAQGADEPKSPNFVRALGGDFKNLVTTKENFVILGVGLGAAWGASYFDDRVAVSGFNSELQGGGSLDAVFEMGETGGDGYVQFALAATTWGAGKLFSSSEIAEAGRDLLRAQIVAGSVTFVIKHAVGRERPDGSSTTSFPSGHTSASFATASVLQRRYGWRAGAPAYAFAAYVAGSRLNEGRHYLSDVIFGAAIGLAAGRTVTLDIARSRFALGPMLVPGGGLGVQLTWVGGS